MNRNNRITKLNFSTKITLKEINNKSLSIRKNKINKNNRKENNMKAEMNLVW